MKAMLIPVYGEPYEIDLVPEANGSTLHALQQAVGGNIEPFTPLFEDSPTLWVNEEGVWSCPPNRAVYATREMEQAGYLSQVQFGAVKENDLYAILYGDIVALGFDPDTGESRDISPEEISRVTDYFSDISPSGSGFIECMAIQSGKPQALRRSNVSLKTESQRMSKGSAVLENSDISHDGKEPQNNIHTNDSR